MACSEMPDDFKDEPAGLKNEEIAEQLNLSKRTVETQISKALKILRQKLSDYRSLHARL
jgi:DNA-directed RNA polymerase specialized sigma24 family protein